MIKSFFSLKHMRSRLDRFDMSNTNQPMSEHTMRKRRHLHLVIRHILLHMRSWLHGPQLHHTDQPMREPSVR